ncbi:unnamed protein product [Schistosoma margrebowiei]|uniref:Uncharacterized protein n=1 Tax=Schistosoma margrebowiei TaxID=48269 RepID=A0A183MMG3_9TREM|nr:unnamed protein product [Schistosoma margrebowiei]
MENVRTRREANIASDYHLVMANLKLKLNKNWTTAQTAIQRFNKAFLRDIDRLNEFKITQQHVPSLTGSTEGRRNYYGGQLERHQKSINFNVSRGSGSKEPSS